jgi:DNA-binding transcriptional LysR family regulator
MGPDGPVYRWEFEKRGRPLTVSVSGPVVVSDAEFMIRAALDGVGLAFMLEDYVREHIARGRLVRVLDDWCPPFDGYFLYYPSRRHQPPALQALVDTLRI